MASAYFQSYQFHREAENLQALLHLFRGLSAEAWGGRGLQGALQPRGDRLWSCHEVHVHWPEVRHFPEEKHVMRGLIDEF